MLNEYLHKDLYAILEVSPDADEVKIKVAYRKMARRYHPDVNNNTPESIEKFKEITEAYELLLDVQKRSQYDILKGFNRKKAEDTQTNRTQAQKAYTEKKTAPPPPPAEKKKQEESFSSVFNTILDGLFPNGEKPSKKQSKKTCKPENGRDINLNVTIKLSEAIQGTHRTVNVLHMEKCPKCEGRKFINGAKCPLCKGTGEVSIHKKLNVKIPAGVKKGSKIRIADEGDKGYNGGKDGDLFLYINIEENSIFKYDGLNVTCEIPITPYEAALGASIDVPTTKGSVSMKIPPLTTSGQKFRLSGQGLKDEKKKKTGDQIVIVKIEIPKEMTKEEIDLYKKLEEISKHNIRENLINGC